VSFWGRESQIHRWIDEWSAEQWLVKVANDPIVWQVHLLDQQIAAAEKAIERGKYQEASDLLVMGLLIDPRKPHAARLLAQAQTKLGSE
jgi:predicted Zn-dependent protease